MERRSDFRTVPGERAQADVAAAAAEIPDINEEMARRIADFWVQREGSALYAFAKDGHLDREALRLELMEAIQAPKLSANDDIELASLVKYIDTATAPGIEPLDDSPDAYEFVASEDGDDQA